MGNYKLVPSEPTEAMIDAERGKWHPIDTVPKDGTKVLLWTPDGIIEAHYRKCLYCDDWWHDWQFSVVDAHSEHVSLESRPTHWMPLLDGPSAILAAPQPEEQQPDVTQLVEALSQSVEYLDVSSLESIGSGSKLHQLMRDALAAHLKQGDES